MNKRYAIVENPKYETLTEMDNNKEYTGRWLFITNTRDNEKKQIDGGVVRIHAEHNFAGEEDGIYDEYENDTDKYGAPLLYDYIMLRDYKGGQNGWLR